MVGQTARKFRDGTDSCKLLVSLLCVSMCEAGRTDEGSAEGTRGQNVI